MKINVDRVALLNALARVRGIVQRRGTLPVLAMVKLTAKGLAVRVEATNLTQSAMVMVRCEVLEEGGTCAPHDKLMALLRALTVDEVTLTRDTSEQLTVKAGRSRSRLSCIHVSEFPVDTNREQFKPIATVDAVVLQALIDRVKGAVSSDESRESFMGVFWRSEGEVLTLTATDGHRLHMTSERVHGAADHTAIIPSLALLKTVLAGADAVRVLAHGDDVAFESDDSRLTVRCISGRFPNIAQVIPDVSASTTHTRATLNCEAMEGALRRAGILSPDTGAVSIVADEEGASLRISAGTSEGEYGEPVNAALEGWNDVGVNGALAVDAMRALGSDAVEVWSGGGDKPMLWRTPGDDTTLCVVMPMVF